MTMKILECISKEGNESYIIGKRYYAFEEGFVTKISNFPNAGAFFSSPLTTLIPTMFKAVEDEAVVVNETKIADAGEKSENDETEQMSLW